MRLVIAALLLLLISRPGLANITNAQAAAHAGEYPTAYEACKEEAEKGDAECQNLLGILFQRGLGVSANPTEALRWFGLAAAQKMPAAEDNIGLAHLNGLGTPKSEKEAARWFGVAAAQGDPVGEHRLALLLLFGKEIENDPSKAIDLLKHGADRGYVPAQLTLALAFESGRVRGGGPANAYIWYLVAERRAHDATQKRLATEGENRTIPYLSGQEIVAAKTAADFWKPVGPTMEAGPFGARPAPASGGAPEANPTKPSATGSGFVVSRAGDIVTNDHVVGGCRETKVVRGGKRSAAQVVAKDPGSDVAIVRLPEPVTELASFREAQPPRPAEPVLVVGYPLQGLLSSDASVTTGIVSALAGPHNDKKQLQITAPVQPGNSGGPLVDASGNVIGVVVGKLNALKLAQATGSLPENVNFAVNAEQARALLDKNSVKYEMKAAGDPVPTPTVAERALKFTVMIECYR
jgi:S1-C subfamily serine protease